MTKFNALTAHNLAMVSALVYQDRDAIWSTVNGKWQITECQFFDVDDTQCLLLADEDTVLVCFRGTEPGTIEDWIVDLDFDLIDGPLDGKVHRGFYESLSNVWQALDRTVASLLADRPRTLWVTGHSMGAALATLAAARWCQHDRAVDGLYTFGQPRTGDQRFSLNFDFALKPTAFRVVNHRDIVTRTPPRALGYRHVGTFKYFTLEGQLVDDIEWWRWFLDGWTGGIDSILDWGGGGIRDHSMVEYLHHLNAGLKNLGLASVDEPPAQKYVEPVRPRRRAA